MAVRKQNGRGVPLYYRLHSDTEKHMDNKAVAGVKTIVAVYVLLIFITQDALSQDGELKRRLQGVWSYHGKKKLFSLNPYYDDLVEVVERDEWIFHADRLEVRSGLYSLTGEEWPKGHYPWIYHGSHTPYELTGNKLKVYSPGSRDWKIFSVQLVNADTILLTADSDAYALVRKTSRSAPNAVKSIHLKVFDPDPFLVRYEVHVKNDRIEIISDSSKQAITAKQYVDHILKGFNQVRLREIRTRYLSEFSENRILELDIEFQDGRKMHSEIIGNNYPPDLKLALIPIIYAGDFIKYGQHWPEKFE